MVLRKLNVDGEFVVWSSSQASATTSATNNRAPAVEVTSSESPSPPKKARIEPPIQSGRSAYRDSQPEVYRLPVLDPYPSYTSPEIPAAKNARVEAPIPSKKAYPVPNAMPASYTSKAPAVIPPNLTAPLGTSYSPYQAGPSQSSASAPVPAPAKRGRKRKADASEPARPPPEKRLARFKPGCPQNILDRVERVMSQRIFMIDRTRADEELREKFSVLGSTGNVYIVTIDHTPRCTCPDHLKGNHCKHILFIFLKVLQVSQHSGYWYQKALLTSELEEIFTQAPHAPNSLAHPHIREAYAGATGQVPSARTVVAPGAAKKRVPGPDDDCPICYDAMHGVAEASLIYCDQCGNALHKECFGQWQRTAATSGKDLTCVWCRAAWVLVPAAGKAAAARGGARRGEDGYLNLAAVAGVSPVRDTSTYYHGPRRGQRYRGYQDYGL